MADDLRERLVYAIATYFAVDEPEKVDYGLADSLMPLIREYGDQRHDEGWNGRANLKDGDPWPPAGGDL